MSQILTPGERSGAWQTVGDHDRRIRALEALEDCCANTDCVDFVSQIFEFADTYPNQLRGYWRLGDDEAGPFLDSKGTSTWANTPMTRRDNSVVLTSIFPGALPDNGDGAIQFNASTGLLSDWLAAPNTWGTSSANPFEELMVSQFTVAGWVKPSESASTFDGSILSMLTFTTNFVGYVLGVAWPARTVFFQTDATRITGPILDADEWSFVVAVHDATSNRIYVNGALAATGASLDPTFSTNQEPLIGRYRFASLSLAQTLYGGVDEVSVWGVALNPEEIGQLFAAGGPCEAEDTSTVEVDGTRYDQILSGTNITATDNLDGTVTLSSSGGDPADDTHVWMPLTTTVGGDDVLVFDADHSLIPTLVPLA